jgi:hypothetical protein
MAPHLQAQGDMTAGMQIDQGERPPRNQSFDPRVAMRLSSKVASSCDWDMPKARRGGVVDLLGAPSFGFPLTAHNL